MGWVYAIRCPARGLVKVGRTDRDPRARLRALQTGQPDVLVLVRVWPCPDSRVAERCMHQLLAAHHYRGEWFSVSEDQVVEAWSRVATGRFGWWQRVRWRVVVARRRAWRLGCRVAA